MGKYDYVPSILSKLGIEKLFHKVKQRPGKPFWFGKSQHNLVFAFPGNPVSTFMCLTRYFIPWLRKCLTLPQNILFAKLTESINFPYPLEFFAQVNVQVNHLGQMEAQPFNSNGSGDYSHLAETNAFMELPLEQEDFRKGEIYKIWMYTN